MLQNSWSQKLQNQPLSATICNLSSPTLVYQTASGQLAAHSSSQSFPLPFRKQVLSIGSLPTGEVVLLTRYQLLCVDFLNNNELFNLQFQNATSLLVQSGMIIVVCDADLFCYDYKGEQQFVNHCSATISALATIQTSGNVQVVVGLNDLTMLRYRSVNIAFDYGKVVGKPVSLCSLADGVLVGTDQGTVAYYQSKKSKWKAKSTHKIHKVLSHRTQTQTLAIIIRRQGTIQLKDWRGKGQTIFKIRLQEQVIAVFVNDFRQDDNLQLLLVHKGGLFRGLNIYQEKREAVKMKIADQVDLAQKQYGVLEGQKLTLEFQIQQLRQIIDRNQIQTVPQDQNIVRADFTMASYIHHQKQGFTLTLQCQNGYVSGLSFEQPIQPVSFDRLQNVNYVFRAQNLVYGQIVCYALVHSNYNSKIYECRPFQISLPKFWKFHHNPQAKQTPTNGISVKLVQRNARYIKWINQGFFMKWTQQQQDKYQLHNPMRMKFYNPYDQQVLQLIFKAKQGKIQIWCDCLKTLGEIFQDLMDYVGVTQMNSELWFPKEKDKLKETLEMIDRLSQAKVSLSSQMADAINNIKFLLVKGESARCVGSMNDLRRSYTQVMGFNRNLLTQIQKKQLNTKELSQGLKTLGQWINNTANVRCGKAKEQVIAGCRQAIKKKQFPKIVRIMQGGTDAL